MLYTTIFERNLMKLANSCRGIFVNIIGSINIRNMTQLQNWNPFKGDAVGIKGVPAIFTNIAEIFQKDKFKEYFWYSDDIKYTGLPYVMLILIVPGNCKQGLTLITLN